MTKKIIATILAGLMLCVAFTGCEKKKDVIIQGRVEENTVESESYRHFHENNELAKSYNFPENHERKAYQSLNSMLLELNAENIAYFVIPNSVGEYLISNDSELSLVKDVAAVSYHMATRVEDTDVCDELNSAISQLEADGSMVDLISEYITNVSDYPAANELTSNPDGKTLVVGVTGDLPPMDYVSSDGTPMGFNVALLNAISKRTGYNFKVVQIEANARMTALAAKKIDIIFWNGCLVSEGFEAAKDTILMTTHYLKENLCFITKDFPTNKIKEIYGLE